MNCRSSTPRVLDSLRQPMENGEVAVSRANHRVTYPARFMLVAAMNPCRCGQAYEPGYACKRGRSDRCTADYQTRISGPLMDRIDLRIEVPAVTAADLILPPPAEGSAEVAARVAAARDIQLKRSAPPPAWQMFAPMPRRRRRYWKLSRSPTRTAWRCCAKPPKPCGPLGTRLSPGGVLRVARTLGRPRRRRENRPAAPGRSVVVPRAGGEDLRLRRVSSTKIARI